VIADPVEPIEQGTTINTAPPVVGGAPARRPLTAWLAEAPELLLFIVGVWLRWRLRVTYDWRWGYDWWPHLRYMEVIATQHRLPSLAETCTAYHPPLYYWLGGFALRHGWSHERIREFSMLAGTARLGVIWYGLRRFLPGARVARCLALVLAGFLPTSLHLDGMLTNEAFNALFATVALVLIPSTFESKGRARLLRSAALAAALAAALMCKLSSLLLLGAVGAGAVAELILGHGIGDRLRRLAPLVMALLIPLAIAVPFYTRHHRETGKWFAVSYDSASISTRYHPEAMKDLPYLDRRALGYVFGHGGAVLKQPYYPADSTPSSRFWPVLVASTFGDYWNYMFAGAARAGEPSIRAVKFPLRTRVIPFQRASVAAGIWISLLVAGTLIAAAVVAIRRRRVGLAVSLSVPVLAVLGQLHFAITFPFDDLGPIKAHYLQYGAAPLFIVFGLGVSRLWRRPAARPLAVLSVIALGVVVTYTCVAQRLF
jgi:hypothetical protein